jgi:hypothetical protein
VGCWNGAVTAIGSLPQVVLAVCEGERSQVIWVSRAQGSFSSVVVSVDVRVLGRSVKRRGLEGIGASFAEARRLVDSTEGAIDGLELLLARLHGC